MYVLNKTNCAIMTPYNQFQTFPTKHVITSVLDGVKIAFLKMVEN